jgi:phosphohistidine phosphatase
MKRLLLLRHAKALPPEGMSDEVRPLAARGRLAMERIGGFFKVQELAPTLALVSPSTRTRETWALLEQALAKKPRVKFVPELYAAPKEAIYEVIQSVPGTVNTLLVIAHNPGLEEITRSLAASGEPEALMRFGRGMPTAALTLFDLSINDWKEIAPKKGRMELFVTPKSLGGDDD